MSSQVVNTDNEELPLVRHHSYLPGSSHILYSDPHRSGRHNIHGNSAVQTLAVLEVPNVVLIPGATLPVRLQQQQLSSTWTESLLQQIDCSKTSGAPVRIGVLCKVTSSSSNSPTQRQTSWMRRAHGPTRLRRLSEQMIAELGHDFLNDAEDYDDDENSVVRDDDDNSMLEEEDVDDNHPIQNNNDTRRTSSITMLVSHAVRSQVRRRVQLDVSVNRQHRAEREQQDWEDYAHAQESAARQRRRSSSYVGRIGTVANVLYTHGYDGEAPIVLTCVGTSRFKIVGYCSSDDERVYNLDHNSTVGSYDERALKNFVVEELKDDPIAMPTSSPPIPFNVTSLNSRERQLKNLALSSCVPICALKAVWPWKVATEIRESLSRELTLVSSNKDKSGTCPKPTSNDRIRVWLANANNNNNHPSPAPLGTVDAAPSHHTDITTALEPCAYSFWLASNLPLQQEERLQVLEMETTIERLRFFKKRTSMGESIVQCANCLTHISRASHLFSVYGAEGTTGNYSNEHGIIHQTITVRSVDIHEICLQGTAVTRDSWFPGYSWTIMACGVCRHHLGWQFNSTNTTTPTTTLTRGGTQYQPDAAAAHSRTYINNNTRKNLNRPNCFYGLSAGSVTIYNPNR